jgi:hypothetical protein
MINFLLREIEKSPNPLFSKKELLARSPVEFDGLLKRKILSYLNPPEGSEERVRFPRCQHGCPLTVVQIEGGLEAVCLDHPEEDPIPIQKDDLNRYVFSIDMFLSQLRSANRIDDALSRIKGGYFYMGYKTYGDNRVGFIFIPNIGKGELVKLSGLRHLCREDDLLIILTSASAIEDVSLKNSLRHDKIIQTSLVKSLNPQTFELPIEKLVLSLLGKKSGQEGSLPEVTKKQKADYEKFDYKCYDKVHLPGTVATKSSNFILVNGIQITIGDSLLILFLRFAVELKQKKGGWTSVIDLKEEGLIDDPTKYQIYSNLRSALRGSLRDKNGKKFIQADGSKNFRISTHPDFITYDRKKLLKHSESRIRDLAKRLP